MHHRLLEISRDLESARQDVLAGYDPLRLYNFRVATRRIRSILKQMDGHAEKGMRKAWGGLTAVTGRARDWDVFLATAEQLLSRERFEEFRAINRERIDSSREGVCEMLASAPFMRHLQDWNAFLENARDQAADPGQAEIALERAIEVARHRFRLARIEENDRNWHRYRIAIKEMRYVAEANPQLEDAAELAEDCKPLQDLLGDWHDTVVQLGMLKGLPKEPVHAELNALIHQRQEGLLKRIRNSPPPRRGAG